MAFALPHVNYLAIFVAGILTMVIGFLWYSPMLFANPWCRAHGWDPNDQELKAKMQKEAWPAYGASFVCSLVSAYVLAALIGRVHPDTTVLGGIKMGFIVWFGFVTTVQLTGNLFTSKNKTLYLIDTGYQLACYLAMGVLLVLWH